MERTELIAREEIRDLVGRYTWAGDRGRSAEVADCFCAEGVLDVGDHGGQWVGRDEIRRRLDEVTERVAAAGGDPTPVHHHVSSIHMRLSEPTRAEVRSYFCVFTPAGPDHWGSYRDVVVLDSAEGGWRFAERRVRVLGTAEGSRFVDG